MFTFYFVFLFWLLKLKLPTFIRKWKRENGIAAFHIWVASQKQVLATEGALSLCEQEDRQFCETGFIVHSKRSCFLSKQQKEVSMFK